LINRANIRDAACAKHVPLDWFYTVKDVALDNFGLGIGTGTIPVKEVII